MAATQLPISNEGHDAFAVAEKAVRAAGAIITRFLPEMTKPPEQRTVKVSNKDGWYNLVTDVDKAAEEAILGFLDDAFPNDAIVAEESGSRAGTSGYAWYIDPLDGTRNFASGVSQICVNLALKHNDDIVLGLTFDPVRNELFHAIEGGGAFINGERISITRQTTLQECLLGTDMGYKGDEGKMLLRMLADMWPGVQSIRMMGSAALGVAYTAAGRFDLYVHHYVQPWDIAPGLLLVREAGGIATDLQGRFDLPESGCIVASSAAVHALFMQASEGVEWRDAYPK